MTSPSPMDCLPPPEIARRAEDVGIAKAHLPLGQMVLLSVLAGAYIAMGAALYTTTMTGASGTAPFGVARVAGGLSFCLGLILVVICGAELFTGNMFLVMGWVGGRLPFALLLRNWVVVYVGNLAGSLAVAYLVYLAQQHAMADGAVGLQALNTANAKCGLSFMVAFSRGVLCNALVCLAVWMTYSCRTTADKILAILFPITAFVACGFEHSVANMYFIPVALFIQRGETAAFWAASGASPAQFADLTWAHFAWANLLPVTLGNIVGGAAFVAGVYWLIYRRDEGATPEMRSSR